MFSTLRSSASTSTAASQPSFGATTNWNGLLPLTATRFGFMFPGMNGVSSTIPAPTSTITTNTVTTTVASTNTFSFGLQSLTLTEINNTVPVSFDSTPFTSTVNAITAPMMTYAQLNRLVNQQSLELENEEKRFFKCALWVNSWDRVLIDNGEKIIALHEIVEKAKLHQERMEQALDFVDFKQSELADLLTYIEVALEDHRGSIYPQHGDEKFERIYKSAENIYAQMKEMAQDLKELTEHMKMVGRPADTTEPLQQITRILNAQLASLQWIDTNSGILQKKVEELTQILKELTSPGARIQQQHLF